MINDKPEDIADRTFRFATSVVKFYRLLDSRPGIPRTVGRQLLRAGTSVGANVEEAQAGQTRADFVSKCSIALKEARETIYWLRLVQATIDSPQEKCEALRAEGTQIARILGAIIVSAKRGRG